MTSSYLQFSETLKKSHYWLQKISAECLLGVSRRRTLSPCKPFLQAGTAFLPHAPASNKAALLPPGARAMAGPWPCLFLSAPRSVSGVPPHSRPVPGVTVMMDIFISCSSA